MYFISTVRHLPPLRFHCVEDAGVEPTNVATWQLDALITRLDLIHCDVYYDDNYL
jgi:hypothetical protein